MASHTSEEAGNERTGRRRMETRARLISAAQEVFNRLGYEATTVSDIVAAAEISRATFYLYFPGKQAVYRAIGSNFLSDTVERFRALDEVLATGDRDAFRTWLAAHLRWCHESYREYSVWNEAEAIEPEVANEIFRTAIAQCLDAMPKFVRRWPRRRHEAFTRLGLLVAQCQIFHYSPLTPDEHELALDILTEAWFDRLQGASRRPPRR